MIEVLESYALSFALTIGGAFALVAFCTLMVLVTRALIYVIQNMNDDQRVSRRGKEVVIYHDDAG